MSNEGRNRAVRIVFACTVTMAMIIASVASVGVIGETAEARGPAYNGPQTVQDGPAYFGPAPNPYPYCDSPTYFDPFPENVNPIGRMGVGDTASVTTAGVTMDLVITAEGNPDTQYPGFFPEGGDGASNDRPKGIELAEGDAARVTLTNASNGSPAPLFYSQWIFTDVDQPNEGFTVTPDWTVPGQAAAFGGDNQFTFAGTSNLAVELDDINGQAELSQSINGRVQVDFLGAVTGIDMLRTFPSNGQSGFAVGGGCEAAGAAKAVVAGPTWNGTGFDVTYELRVRNNLPSSATIQSVIDDAVAGVGASTVTGTPQGIILDNLQLTDDLRDDAFSAIEVTGLSTDGGLTLNNNFNGITDFELISGGSIDAEENEVITLSVEYTPDLATANWGDCALGYDYLNQTQVTGSAANVVVSDLSDDGLSAQPSNNNGSGGVDDPTPVKFPCPPGGLQIVKTVVVGPNGTCPTFANGVVGDGPALPVIVDDVVTYCVSVRNPGPGPITNVVVSDAQAPGDISLPDLAPGQEAGTSYDVQVDISTPPVNTATATADDVNGPLDPEQDTAVIAVSPKDQPLLEIVKTVVVGPNGTCPSFANGVDGLGPALAVNDGDTVTYCISVQNVGPGAADNVVISDPQAPQDYVIGTLLTGEGATESYDLVVDLNTDEVNVATGAYEGPDGPRDPVDDDAQIDVSPLLPVLEIVKTVVPGPNGTCPTFDNGVVGLGPALAVNDRETVTYCVSVLNSGAGVATGVLIDDAQSPSAITIGTLAAGQGQTVSYDVLVGLSTPTVNTATATGNGPNGPLDDASDPAQIAVNALPDPLLQIVKTALRGPNASCPTFDNGVEGLGNVLRLVETDVVTYCISVRNNGAGPATDVVLRDAQAPNTFDLNIGDLASGAEVTRSYDVTVDLQTPEVNTAFANGTGLNGALPEVSDPAVIEVNLQPDPVLEIVKTVVTGPDGACPADFDAGTPGDGAALGVLYDEVVTYCITVRNSGDNPATSVTINDAQAPGVFQIGTLAVGDEASASYDIVVNASTPALNTATTAGLGPNGPVGPVSDTALINPQPQPDPILEIVKTVVRGPAGVCPSFADGVDGEGDALDVLYGDVVTYCITIRNTGGNDANDVQITDPQAPSVYDIGTLAVGASETVSYDVTITADTPARNVATVTGTGPNGDLDPVDDPALINPEPQPDPVLEIVKTVVLGPNGTCPSFADGVAGPGDALVVAQGQTVTYCVAIQNTGAGEATNVQISDDQSPDSPFQIGTLASGQGRLVQYDIVVTQNIGLRNVAVVTGTAPDGDPTPPVDDDAIIETRSANISLIHSVSKADEECVTVAKNRNSLVANSEDLPITWCALITNNGSVPLTNIVLTVPKIGDGQPIDVLDVTDSGIVLLRGESLRIEIPGTIPDTGLISNADVQADPSDEQGNVLADVPRPRDDDNAEVREASINIETTVAAGANADCDTAVEVLLIPSGQDITWCFEVTNTGAVDLLVTRVTDPLLGVTALIPEGQRVLRRGATILVSANGLSEDGIVIDADVRGKPLNFDGTILDEAPEVEDIDPAEVIVPEADVQIVKTNSDAGPINVGEELDYTLVITNNGPNRARGVEVTDSLPVGISYVTLPGDPDWACSMDADETGFACLKATNLAAGESVTLTYTARINASAPSSSVLVNTAKVTSITPDDDPTNNEDTSETETPVPFEQPVVPGTPTLEYPGPFTPPPAAPPLNPPDEVLGLALTGSSSSLLALVSAAMMALGGLLTVGARRSRDDEE